MSGTRHRIENVHQKNHGSLDGIFVNELNIFSLPIAYSKVPWLLFNQIRQI